MFEAMLEESVCYFNSLQLSGGKLLSTSRRKTFVLGFEVAAKSFINLSRYLFEHYTEVKYMLGYKLSQDHIETLFSKIRSKGGFNNNPDIRQFKSALKSLLVKTEITPSSNANCLEIDSPTGLLLLRPKHAATTSTEEEDVTEVEEAPTTLQLDLPKALKDIVEYISKL